MKINILCSNYEPGGAQRAAIRLNKQLKQEGYTCELYFFHPKSIIVPEDNLKFILERRIQSPIDFLDFLSKLGRKISDERPDVVLTFLPFANIIGQFMASWYKVPKRVASHRNVSEKELRGVMRILDRLWAEIGVYTRITAVSDSTKRSFKYYSEKAYNKIVIVNNGLNFVPSPKPKETCRQKFKLANDQFIIGNIGRLVEQKNQQLLVQILPKLNNTMLVIVGKGELRNKLYELSTKLNVTNRLKIIDEINAVDIPDFYKAIDVFVMPSLYEGLSNALIEALAAGVPVISSDVPSQRDVLYNQKDNSTAGILLSLDSRNLWIDQINRIIADNDLRKNLQNRSVKRSKDFTMNKMVDGFLRAITKK